jgi:hypothetical protein
MTKGKKGKTKESKAFSKKASLLEIDKMYK